MKTVLKTAGTKIAGMFLGNQSDILCQKIPKEEAMPLSNVALSEEKKERTLHFKSTSGQQCSSSHHFPV